MPVTQFSIAFYSAKDNRVANISKLDSKSSVNLVSAATRFINVRWSSSTIRVAQFGLFLSEDQTIRCKGRIALLPTSSKSPILLPAKHTFVKLVVKQTHDRVKHSGINATLTALRERYWVLRGRETVKKVVRHCVVCRRYEASPCKSSRFADLPSTRVSDDPPFTHIGLDFAGPLYVKEPRRSSQTGDSNLHARQLGPFIWN